jgi:2-C-methyl-D-erythritol 2,4-cyclodiphosphate synthase
MRIGQGYDVHRFAENRKLMLGGIEIPHTRGLSGHSDADVLLHAITDAILGALALGDIGTHFPDDDPEFKNADSRLLLEHSYNLVRKRGYTIMNTDSTVVAEQPKLKPYISDIRESISDILQCEISRVSVKATTAERMGFIGREEGIAVYSVVLLKEV